MPDALKRAYGSSQTPAHPHTDRDSGAGYVCRNKNDFGSRLIDENALKKAPFPAIK